MSLRFVHFSNTDTRESGTSIEKALFTLRNYYLETLELQTNDPLNPVIPERYTTILESPLMEGLSIHLRDLRLELKEASCWGLACYNQNIEKDDFALAWLFKNLSSRVHLWNHPNCMKVVEKIARIAWKNKWYHVVRWSSQILESMINDFIGIFTIDFFYLHVKTLFIIGEWDEMNRILNNIEKMKNDSNLYTSSSFQPNDLMISYEENKSTTSKESIELSNGSHYSQFIDAHVNGWINETVSSSNLEKKKDEYLSDSHIQLLKSLGSIENIDYKIRNNAQNVILSILPDSLLKRREEWLQSIKSKLENTHFEQNEENINKILILKPQTSTEEQTETSFFNLSRAFYKAYKNKILNHQDLNSGSTIIQVKSILINNEKINESISKKRKHSDLEAFEKINVSKRLKTVELVNDVKQVEQDPLIFNPFNQDLLTALRNTFAECHENSAEQQNEENISSTILSNSNILKNTSKEPSINDFVYNFHTKSLGLLDSIHEFIEYSIQNLKNIYWPQYFKLYFLKIVEKLYKIHSYKFNPEGNLILAELFFEQYISQNNNKFQRFKVISHMLCSECHLPEEKFEEHIRLLYLYGNINARTNPKLSRLYFEKCINKMKEKNINQIFLPHISIYKNINLKDLETKVNEMYYLEKISQSEKFILRKNTKMGSSILKTFLNDHQLPQEAQVHVRDLIWTYLLLTSYEEIVNEENLSDLITYAIEKTPTFILSNYNNCRIALSRIYNILHQYQTATQKTQIFTNIQREKIIKKLFNLLKLSFDDFYNAKDGFPFHLVDILLYTIGSARIIGTYSGDNDIIKLHSNYRSLFLLQQIIFQKARIPKDQTYASYLILEYFNILKQCNNLKKQIESTLDTENEYELNRLQKFVKYAIAYCLYLLYGKVFIDSEDSAFISWRQKLDRILGEDYHFLKLSPDHAKIAFYILEEYAQTQLNYDLNPKNQLQVNQALCTIFNCVSQNEITFDTNIIQIEKSNLQWNDELILNNLQDEFKLVLNEDSDFENKLNILLAKSQMKFTIHGPEEERNFRFNYVLNLIRNALTIIPTSSETWQYFGEFYFNLVQIHLDQKNKNNQNLILIGALRQNLELSEESEGSFENDLDTCIVRALRCFFIALQLNEESFVSAFYIPNLFYQLLRRKIIPSLFQSEENLFSECLKYIEKAQYLINDKKSRYKYQIMLLKAKLYSVSIDPIKSSYEYLIPLYSECYKNCIEYLKSIRPKSTEHEDAKKDLSEILLYWTSEIFNVLKKSLKEQATNLTEIETFLLNNIYRVDPSQDLIDAEAIGYLQGTSISPSYLDVVPYNQTKYDKQPTKKISVLWNLIYLSIYECLKINPLNHNAVMKLSEVISSKYGPWESYSVGQKVIWTLFKHKMAGSTKRPDLFEIDLKDRTGCEDVSGIENALKLLSKFISKTMDIKIISLLLSGLRKTYTSYGETMVDIYFKGILLLIKYLEEELQKKKIDKKSSKDKESFFKLVSIAFIYLRDPDIEIYYKNKELYNNALKSTEEILFSFVKDYQIRINIEKGEDKDNENELIKYHKANNYNLTRRYRVSGKPHSSVNIKLGFSGYDNVPNIRLKSQQNIEKSIFEEDEDDNIENRELLDDDEMDGEDELDGEDIDDGEEMDGEEDELDEVDDDEMDEGDEEGLEEDEDLESSDGEDDQFKKFNNYLKK